MTSNKFRIVTNQFQLDQAKKEIDQYFADHQYVEIQTTTAKTRTQRQNRALHVFLRQLSAALLEKQVDTRMFFKKGFGVPFTPEIVKDNIWRPLQIAVTGKKSSKDLTRQEVSEIYDHLNKILSTGDYKIYVPFPEAEK